MIPEPHPGTVVHAKSVELFDSRGNSYTYSAPRGQRFAMILMNVVPTPKDAEGIIHADNWLKEQGWDLVPDNK